MPGPAIELWLELEARCNLHCRFCYNYWRGTEIAVPKRISSLRLQHAIRRLLDATECVAVSISGGEPLLARDLPEIVELIASFGIPIALTTNGTLLNEQNCADLVSSGVSTFQIPLHSLEPVMHDFLSGCECFHQTLRGFVSVLNAGGNLVPVVVSTRKNLHHLGDVLRLAKILELPRLIVNRFVPGGLGLKYANILGVPSDDEMISALLSVDEFAQQSGIILHLGVPVAMPQQIRDSLQSVRTASCTVAKGQRKWTLDFAGNLRRCSHSDHIFANLLGDGLDLLLEEVAKGNEAAGNESRTCAFLAEPGLVNITNVGNSRH